MNDNYIEIKEKRGGFLLKGFLLLASMVMSLFFSCMPFITTSAKTLSVLFYLIGGTFFLITLALFILHLYKEINPRNALILKAHGFIDCINVGSEIEIDWTNVASVKMLGKKEAPFFGINLENTDIVLAKMGTTEADEMRNNIEDNLPAILISQSEIRISMNELKNLFVKFVREARALESDTKKQKSNPFSSEDVLRAFGHLPIEPQDVPAFEADNSVVSNTYTSEPENFSDNIPFTEDVNDDGYEEYEHENENDDNETPSKGVFTDDEFYASLDKIIQEDAPSISTTNDCKQSNTEIENDAIIAKTTEEMEADETSREIEALLSKAKSSRISELEKLLTDDTSESDTSNTCPMSRAENISKQFEETKEFDFSFSSLHDVIPDSSDSPVPDFVIPEDAFGTDDK